MNHAPPRPRASRARLAGAIALAVASASAMFACASPPNSGEQTEIYTGSLSFQEFTGGGTNVGVQGLLAARCGTLDCHGQVGRPLRIFSQYGLRLVDDAGNVSGSLTETTTPQEVFANFVAAVGVQPELTSKAFAGKLDPHELLILRKPLGAERHKGGQVFQSGGSDPGDVCLTTWLNAQGINYAACKAAAAIP